MFKKISIVVIALFLFGGSTFAFAWWDDLETSDEITIGVGEGVTLSASVDESIEDEEVLVPNNVVQKENDVNEAAFTYTVSLDNEEDITSDLELKVDISDIEVGGESDDDGFINVDGDETYDFDVDEKEIKITVTLDDVEDDNEPNDGIQNEDITFDVTFTALIQD